MTAPCPCQMSAMQLQESMELSTLNAYQMRLCSTSSPMGLNQKTSSSTTEQQTPQSASEDPLMAVHIAGGDDLQAIKYLPLKLKAQLFVGLTSFPSIRLASGMTSRTSSGKNPKALTQASICRRPCSYHAKAVQSAENSGIDS